jgi:hypothetical protein
MAPKLTTTEKAINAALAAGFEIVGHGAYGNVYAHQMRDAFGREILIRSELGTGKLIKASTFAVRFETGAKIYYTWINVRTARSVPGMFRMLAHAI